MAMTPRNFSINLPVSTAGGSELAYLKFRNVFRSGSFRLRTET
jgi:hypothetical protein